MRPYSLGLAVVVAAVTTVGCTADDPGADSNEICGNGVAEAREDCDGADLHGRTCADFGFNAGQLGCLAACVVDLRGCALVEQCSGGRDDDGDALADCADPDCADDAACAVCGDGRVTGGEQCEDGVLAGACCAACRAAAGCEVEPNDGATTAMRVPDGATSIGGTIAPADDADVYRVDIPAGSTARVVARVVGAGGRCPPARLDLVGPDGELRMLSEVGRPGFAQPVACAEVDVAGVSHGASTLRVVASEHADEGAGPFAYRLELAVELAPCGDAVLDEGQECDDGNAIAGDGCTGCRLEAHPLSERDEPLALAAGPFTPPFAATGELVPEAQGVEHDWVAVLVDRRASVRVDVTSSSCRDVGQFGTLLRVVGGFQTPVAVPFPTPSPTVCLRLESSEGRTGPTLPQDEPQMGGPTVQLDPGLYYLHIGGGAYREGSRMRYRAIVTYTSVCGDGAVDSPEECDGGALCDARCRRSAPETCGDGRLDEGEECDDGNRQGNDGCSATCAREGPANCGNGRPDPGEQCDDGNFEPGDCCSATCTREIGCEIEPNDEPETGTTAFGATRLRGMLLPPFDTVDHFFVYLLGGDVELSSGVQCLAPRLMAMTLTGELLEISTRGGESGCLRLRVTAPAGAYLLTLRGDSGGSYDLPVTQLSVCGDMRVTGTETCDDLTPLCLQGQCLHRAECGDGILTAPETCDDGNREGGDGCSATCAASGGGVCGDGALDPGETCDDGNREGGDGCSPDCALEPSCGDGVLDDGEACDDGNLVSGDGCSPGCVLEPGHVAEQEPNDDGTPSVANSDFLALAAGGPFTSDVTVHAAIGGYGDDDVFAVANPGAAAVQVTAETFGPTPGACLGIATHLRVRDANGALLHFDADSGLDRCSRLGFTLDPGATLYLQVTDAGDNSLLPAYLLEIGFVR